MPQMGESIAEGTVSKWLKQVGQAVERDEPILEISTDKVDAEIPAPAAGTIVSIEVREGETVEVGTIVAYIDTEAAPSGNGATPKEAAPVAAQPVATSAPESDESTEEGRMRSTPVVRKIAEEHGVDVARVEGTGHAGRVTKQDILAYIEGGRPEASTAPGNMVAPATPSTPRPALSAPTPPAPAAPQAKSPAAAQSAPSDLWKTFYGQVQHPEFPVREGDRVEAMDKIRRLTAEHMVLAKRVAPHVHSFIEIDFTAIDKVRKDSKKKWETQGAKVSYTAFVVWAVSRLLRDATMCEKLRGAESADGLYMLLTQSEAQAA